MRTALSFPCIVTIGLLLGCASLDPLVVGDCGNGVVDASEDCDTFPEKADSKGHRCVAPGSTGECHFQCETGGGKELACPAGYGCGEDSLCRRASGSFEGAVASLNRPARALFSGNFDGDSRRDALVVGESGIEAIYIGPSGAFEQTAELPFFDARPGIGDLTSDGIDDIVSGVGDGIGVFRGSSERTFAPSAYSTVGIQVTEARILGVDVLPEIPGQEPMALFASASDKMPLFHVNPNSLGTNMPTPFQFVTGKYEKLATSLPTGQLDEDPVTSPCEEIVVGFKDDSKILVLFTCHPASGDIVLNQFDKPGFLAPVEVLLSAGTLSGKVLLHDLNNDGHLDLVLGVDGALAPVHVAYGVGDGTFHSNVATIPASDGNNQALAHFGFPSFPLALGDLNEDGVTDFVTEQGVYASGMKSGSLECPGSMTPNSYHAVACSTLRWEEAQIADLNGNGHLDVIAATGKQSGLDFYNGVGNGQMNHQVIKTDGVPRFLTIGDFDGDLLLDVAVAQGIPGSASGPPGEAGGGPPPVNMPDDLTVLFGRTSGAPEAPRSMGRFAPIRQMVPANITTGKNQLLDAISELGVLSEVAGTDGKVTALQVAILTGSGDRQLQSPFFFSGAPEDNPIVRVHHPVVSVVGELTGGDDLHADICTMTRNQGDKAGLWSSPRLWLAPSTGEAFLDPSAALPSVEMPDSSKLVGRAEPLLAVVDLDRAGPAEVVALYTRSEDDPFTAELVIYRSQGGALVADEPSQTVTDLQVADAGRGANQLLVRDVDGDGYPDLVTIASLDEKSFVMILWNDEGSFDLARRTEIELVSPNGDPPTAFAVLEADGDPTLEIVVSSPGQTILVDIVDREVGEARQIEEIRGAQALLAYDFTGDGIDDLLVGVGSGVELHPGIARNK